MPGLGERIEQGLLEQLEEKDREIARLKGDLIRLRDAAALLRERYLRLSQGAGNESGLPLSEKEEALRIRLEELGEHLESKGREVLRLREEAAKFQTNWEKAERKAERHADEMAQNQANIERLQRRIDEKDAALENGRERLETLESERERLETTRDAARKETESLRAMLNREMEESAGLRQALAELRERKSDWENDRGRLEVLEEKRDELLAELHRAEVRWESSEGERKVVVKALDEKSEEIRSLREQLVEASNTVERLREEAHDLTKAWERKEARQEEDIRALWESVEQAEKERDEFRESAEALRKQVRDSEERLERMQAENDEDRLAGRIEELQGRIEESESSRERMIAELEELRESLSESERKRRGLESRNHALAEERAHREAPVSDDAGSKDGEASRRIGVYEERDLENLALKKQVELLEKSLEALRGELAGMIVKRGQDEGQDAKMVETLQDLRQMLAHRDREILKLRGRLERQAEKEANPD